MSVGILRKVGAGDYDWKPSPKPSFNPKPIGYGAFDSDHDADNYVAARLKDFIQKNPKDPSITGISQWLGDQKIKQTAYDRNSYFGTTFKKWLLGKSHLNDPKVTSWGHQSLEVLLPNVNQWHQKEIAETFLVQRFLYHLFYSGPQNEKVSHAYY